MAGMPLTQSAMETLKIKINIRKKTMKDREEKWIKNKNTHKPQKTDSL